MKSLYFWSSAFSAKMGLFTCGIKSQSPGKLYDHTHDESTVGGGLHARDVTIIGLVMCTIHRYNCSKVCARP
jgi:hypothetical protein